MPQVIQIKRTTGAVGDKKLHKGELAYSSHDDKLYIGAPDQDVDADGLGSIPPVMIGGTAYTEMLVPPIPNIDSDSGQSAASLVLGDNGMTQAGGVKDPTNFRTVSISAPDTINTSYSVVMPATIGTQNQVLSVTNDTGSSTSASLGWIDVTSTIEGADDSLITTPTAGQMLFYQSDMDGDVTAIIVLATATPEEIAAGTHMTPAAAEAAGNVYVEATGVTLFTANMVPDSVADGATVYQITAHPVTPGWINKSLSGAVTIDSDGATSIEDTGSQTVKEYIEAASSLVLLGDLTVKGDTTHVNSNVVAIQDKSLALGITGGMKTVTNGIIGTDGTVLIPHTQTNGELEQGEFVYIGEGNENIPVGTYPISNQAVSAFEFIIPGFEADTDNPITDQTISFSSSSVTDTLATGAGFLIPGDTGLKSITYDGTDSFVSNQNLDIVSDTSQPAAVDEVRTQTISVDGEEIAEVIQTWDATLNDGAGGVVETVTIGSETTAWDGVEISAVKGGTGLKVDEITRGDVLISPADNEWNVLNGLGELTAVADTDDNQPNTANWTPTYTNSILDTPATVAEITAGTYPANPTGALLTLNHDHSFQWSTHIDGGMWSS